MTDKERLNIVERELLILSRSLIVLGDTFGVGDVIEDIATFARRNDLQELSAARQFYHTEISQRSKFSITRCASYGCESCKER